jgi:hypothetical protein
LNEHPVTAAYAGIFLFIVGIALGVFTWELNRREAAQIEGWSRTDGVVTMVFGSGSSTRAMVSFKTPSGDRINFTARPRIFRRPANGQSVAVLYPPFNPPNAVLDPAPVRWLRNALLGTASLVLSALGAYVAWYARQWDSRRLTNGQ